jgi:hypothetical protein
MKTLNDAYKANEADVRAVSEELFRLEQKRALLIELGAAPVGKVKPAKAPKKAGKRAPKGAVLEAVLGALSSKGMTNAEVREALRAKGYSHSLHVLHMGKVLNRLVAKGTVSKATVGNRVEFTLK